MALVFCDSFGHYPTADLTKKWSASNGAIITTNPRFPGVPYLYGSSSYPQTWRLLPTASDTWIIGMGYRWGGGNEPLFSLYDSSTGLPGSAPGCQVDFRCSGGRIDIYRGRTENGTLLASVNAQLLSGAWNYFETKIVIGDGTDGKIYLRKNGVQIYANEACDTRNAGATADISGPVISSGNSDGSGSGSYSDFYICDDTGSYNNDFLGDIRVQAIMPSGAGGTTQWTPSTGSNYQCVDETTALGDGDYVSETTAGEKDTYAFGNVTPTTGTVKAVQVLLGARKDDAGSRSIAPVYGNGTPASDVDGTTVSIGDTYEFYREITEQDPVAASNWTISSVNAAEFGVKLVS